MAVRNKEETCMFCMSNPCSCYTKPPAKKSPPRKVTTVNLPPQEVVTPEPKKRAGITAIPTTQTKEVQDDGPEFRRAITVLCASGLVCYEDVKKHRNDLDLSPTQIDVLLWKIRRQEWKHKRQEAI